jgi:C-methyltransferase C-terminal domain/Putative zinc binding domain
VDSHECRACRGQAGHLVLDLGDQPACDYFPMGDVPGPDPVYPLGMWLCSSCGLAQLLTDPTVPAEPKGVEPAALISQAADAVRRVAVAGLLPPGGRVAEYGSPHGGSWLGLLADLELTSVAGEAVADVVLDCFGLMHAADQSAAIARRARRVAPGGVLLLQYHSLDAIIRQGQWNAVLLAARRDEDVLGKPDDTVRSILSAEAQVGIRDPDVLGRLQHDLRNHVSALRQWLRAAKAVGQTVLGYGAASRAVALLSMADVDHALLGAVADASAAKQGLRMPGTRIPIISPKELTERRPDVVLVFVSDLLNEVRAAYPGIEANGGRWVAADTLTAYHPS